MQVELRGITKRFGAVLANDAVDLALESGKVLALLGENGAGKSTLMKILYGFYQADAGEILIDGQGVLIVSPQDAIAQGIGMLFQQFSLIPAFSVRENLILAHPRAPWLLGHHAKRWRGALTKLDEIAPEIDPDRPVNTLSVGEMQLVELAKVLGRDAKLVILDEPTAVLIPAETERLWHFIRQLAAAGAAVVMITHKLDDVYACADDVSVMRQGRVVANVRTRDQQRDDLIRLMMGGETLRAPEAIPTRMDSAIRVAVKALAATSVLGSVNGIDLKLAAGEILGIAGVSGNGQNVLAEALVGVTPLHAGEVIVDGVTLCAPRMGNVDRSRIAYIPEDPLRNAVAPDLSAAVNLFLNEVKRLPLFPDRHRMQSDALRSMQAFDVRPPDPTLAVNSLSGGNLQRLVIARELAHEPALIVACYPTMGLDSSATAMVYERLFAHARRGACVVWISEDLDDLLRYAHRIAIMLRGRVAGIVNAGEASRQQIGALMAGSVASRQIVSPAIAGEIA